MATVVPKVFNLAVCQALGLDPLAVRSVTLRCEADRAPALIVEQLVSPATAGRLLELFKTYDLTERKS